MPKIFEYFGLLIFFYSNEHEPIHVHGKYDGLESKAEFYLDESKFKEYKIIDGNLNWNDYDMIFPIEDLYQGRV